MNGTGLVHPGGRVEEPTEDDEGRNGILPERLHAAGRCGERDRADRKLCARCRRRAADKQAARRESAG